MKNILISIIIGASLIISSYLFRDIIKWERYKEPSQIGRYKIIMNSGGETAGIITIKYDTATGRTWRLTLPDNQWVEIKDYGWIYPMPKTSNQNE